MRLFALLRGGHEAPEFFLQPLLGSRYAVFLTHECESLQHEYERDPGNPRVLRFTGEQPEDEIAAQLVVLDDRAHRAGNVAHGRGAFVDHLGAASGERSVEQAVS